MPHPGPVAAAGKARSRGARKVVKIGVPRVSRTRRRLRPRGSSGRARPREPPPRRATMQPQEIAEVLNRPLSRELLARDLTRLAYVAGDGTPRSIPIAFTWNGTQIVLCTTKNAPKLHALRANPMVALTIDTEVHPPKILL